MFRSFDHHKTHFSCRALSLFLVMALVFTLAAPPSIVQAQSLPGTVAGLPSPGMMLPVSPEFHPPIVKGMTLHPDNPLKIDFIIDSGEENLQGEAFEKEAGKLIKYFLTSLTVPEKELWVNLSPYEQDRIVPEVFGQTEMGRDLLAQDYILKQLTASLIYPENELGKEFWNRVRAKAKAMYGTTDIPMNTFNKVWIVPEKASVYENGNSVFIVERRLKVMLEEDYVALFHNERIHDTRHRTQGVQKMRTGKGMPGDNATPLASREQRGEQGVSTDNQLQTTLIKELIIPEIEREVNEGKNFANLRQIYHSMLLATWYKRNLKESFLGQAYADQNKIQGVETADEEIKQKIYEQYLEAFKQGAYNYIKEDYDEGTRAIVPRKYFSGGAVGDNGVPITTVPRRDFLMIAKAAKAAGHPKKVQISLTSPEAPSDQAMVFDKNFFLVFGEKDEDASKKPTHSLKIHHDVHGSEIGRTVTRGNTTIHYDRHGSETGRTVTRGNTTTHYDRHGSETGSEWRSGGWVRVFDAFGYERYKKRDRNDKAMTAEEQEKVDELAEELRIAFFEIGTDQKLIGYNSAENTFGFVGRRDVTIGVRISDGKIVITDVRPEHDYARRIVQAAVDRANWRKVVDELAEELRIAFFEIGTDQKLIGYNSAENTFGFVGRRDVTIGVRISDGHIVITGVRPEHDYARRIVQAAVEKVNQRTGDAPTDAAMAAEEQEMVDEEDMAMLNTGADRYAEYQAVQFWLELVYTVERNPDAVFKLSTDDPDIRHRFVRISEELKHAIKTEYPGTSITLSPFSLPPYMEDSLGLKIEIGSNASITRDMILNEIEHRLLSKQIFILKLVKLYADNPIVPLSDAAMAGEEQEVVDDLAEELGAMFFGRKELSASSKATVKTLLKDVSERARALFQEILLSATTTRATVGYNPRTDVFSVGAGHVEVRVEIKKGEIRIYEVAPHNAYVRRIVQAAVDKANSQQRHALATTDKAMTSPGGIDLNSEGLDIDRHGSKTTIPVPAFSGPMPDIRIEGGLFFNIITITPANIPLILGIAPPSADEQKSADARPRLADLIADLIDTALKS